MRISDWSSDVCSSDLSHRIEIREFGGYADRVNVGEQAPRAKREFRGHGARERGCHFLVTGECDGAEFPQVGQHQMPVEIGRASCRESVCQYVYLSVVPV